MAYQVSPKLNNNNNQQNTAGQLDNRMQSMFSDVPTYNPQADMTNFVRDNQLQDPSTMQNIDIGYDIGQGQQVQAPNINRTNIENIGNFDTSGIQSRAAQAGSVPDAKAGQIEQYFDPSTLRNDIYSGIEANVNQSKEEAMRNLKETMSNAGLFRSGLTLENQQDVERDAMDSLAKGWGQTATQVAGIQSDIAKTQAQLDTQTNIRNTELKNDLNQFNAQLRQQTNIQNAKNMLQAKMAEYQAQQQRAIEQGRLDQAREFEQAKNNLQAQMTNVENSMQRDFKKADLATQQAAMDFDVSKYNSDIQNAWSEKNFDYLMNANAQDQQAINQANQFNVDVQNAYDEMAFKWANAMLDQEIREYAANLDYLAKEGNTIAQFGTEEANEEWSNLRPQIQDSIFNNIGVEPPERSIPDYSPTRIK